MQVKIPSMDGMGRASFNVEHYFFSAIPGFSAQTVHSRHQALLRDLREAPKDPLPRTWSRVKVKSMVVSGSPKRW